MLRLRKRIVNLFVDFFGKKDALRRKINIGPNNCG
jgi:hypothetical protein